MERVEVILIAGIIIALIWLGACVIIEGKKRKYVIMTGVIIDIVLFLICRNWEMLCIGVFGGVFCTLFAFFYSTRKFETAVGEMKGVKNLMVALVIFCVMVFMTMSIAYPELKVSFSAWF